MATKRDKKKKKRFKKKRKESRIKIKSPVYLEAQYGLDFSDSKDIKELTTFKSEAKGFQNYFATSNGKPLMFAQLSAEGNLKDMHKQMRKDMDEKYSDDSDRLNPPDRIVISLKKPFSDEQGVEQMMKDVVSDLNKNRPPDNQFSIDLSSNQTSKENDQLQVMTFRLSPKGQSNESSPQPANPDTSNQNSSPGKPDPNRTERRDEQREETNNPTTSLGVPKGILSPEGFEKEMGKGKFSKRSKEYSDVLNALKDYNSSLQNLQKSYRDNLNKNVSSLEEGDVTLKHQRLKEAAERYIQTESKTVLKKNKVQDMLDQLGSEGLTIERLNNIHQGVQHEIDRNIEPKLVNEGAPTDSKVYVVKTNGNIGKSGTNEGFMKKEIAYQEGEFKTGNDTTLLVGKADLRTIENLNIPVLTGKPKLLSRQVASSRLDEALGANVLSTEVFSTSNGENVVISSKASGIEMTKTKNGKKVIPNIDPEKNGETQRGLANLQLMDALTGQMDRHNANIFIDPNTGKVTGIDNDMAFPNGINHKQAENMLPNQFKDAKGSEGREILGKANGKEVFFTQKLVDKKVGKKVLAMTEDQFLSIIQGREGDPQRLDPQTEKEAIDGALQRFRAIKKHIKELDDAGKLVENWGPATYKQATSDDQIHKSFNSQKPMNYILKLHKVVSAAKDNQDQNVVFAP